MKIDLSLSEIATIERILANHADMLTGWRNEDGMWRDFNAEEEYAEVKQVFKAIYSQANATLGLTVEDI